MPLAQSPAVYNCHHCGTAESMIPRAVLDKLSPIPMMAATVTCKNPGPMARELRHLADMLEKGDLEYKEGGLVVRSTVRGIRIESNLLLVPTKPDGFITAPLNPDKKA